MNTYLNAIRSLDIELNAPASLSALRSMAEVIGHPLLDDLRTLYQDHGGVPRSRHPAMRFIMRLMSPSEVAKIMGAVRQNFPGALDKCAGLFWTDDNSHYAGAFLAPPMLGRVFFLNRDELGYTPPGSEALSPSATR